MKNYYEKKEIGMKYLLLTHSLNCMDGQLCAVIFNKKMREMGVSKDNFEIHRSQYGEEYYSPEQCKDKHVIVADFSYPQDVMDKMNEVAKSFIVFDHHDSVPDDVKEKDYFNFENNKCGALLLTDYLYPNEPIPELILSIDARDRWISPRWTENINQDQEVSAALALMDKRDLESFEPYLNDINSLIEKGSSVLRYQEQIVKKASWAVSKNKVMRIKWCGYDNIPLLNTNHLISEVGNVISLDNPFALMFFFTDTKLVISFRSDGVIDGTKLAFRGHAAACGIAFNITTEDLYNKLFIEKEVDLEWLLENRVE